MKKLIFGSAVALVIFVSACKKDKDCNATAPTKVASAAEIANVQTYLANTGITNAVQHPSGMFYTINPQGNGESPNLCSTVTIQYRGNVFNTVAAFDSTPGTSNRAFPLNQLIAGWQLALPLVKTGGSVTLYIPPSLGYGSSSPNAAIPANSYLRFTINLQGVDNP
jgi:FKBP-type peptidyl-prolyl cis-trans isomerase FkpA